VAGKVAPEMTKPVPFSVTELTVTAVTPVDVKVSVFVDVVFTGTVPKSRTLALIDNWICPEAERTTKAPHPQRAHARRDIRVMTNPRWRLRPDRSDRGAALSDSEPNNGCPPEDVPKSEEVRTIEIYWRSTLKNLWDRNCFSKAWR